MAAFMESPNLGLNHLILKDHRRIQQTAVVGRWLLVVGNSVEAFRLIENYALIPASSDE